MKDYFRAKTNKAECSCPILGMCVCGVVLSGNSFIQMSEKKFRMWLYLPSYWYWEPSAWRSQPQTNKHVGTLLIRLYPSETTPCPFACAYLCRTRALWLGNVCTYHPPHCSALLLALRYPLYQYHVSQSSFIRHSNRVTASEGRSDPVFCTKCLSPQICRSLFPCCIVSRVRQLA